MSLREAVDFIANVINEVADRYPSHVLALLSWIRGSSGPDVERNYGVSIRQINEVLRGKLVVIEVYDSICADGRCVKRYDVDFNDLMSRVAESVARAIIRSCSDRDLMILRYVVDLIVRHGRYDVYEISDCIRCCEDVGHANVEHEVISLCSKYLLASPDASQDPREHHWILRLSEHICRALGDRCRAIDESKIVSTIEMMASSPDGLEVLAAMHSMCFNAADQFKRFHGSSVEEYLAGLKRIPCVYSEGFANPVAMRCLESYVKRKIVDELVRLICRCTKVCNVVSYVRERTYHKYVLSSDERDIKITVVAPAMYYYSPIFWAHERSINIVPNVPHRIEQYLSTYRPYFNDSIVMFSKLYGVHSVHCISCSDMMGAIYDTIKSLILRTSSDVH